jgi:hypothetical protein
MQWQATGSAAAGCYNLYDACTTRLPTAHGMMLPQQNHNSDTGWGPNCPRSVPLDDWSLYYMLRPHNMMMIVTPQSMPNLPRRNGRKPSQA